jgi:hypothetical protein
MSVSLLKCNHPERVVAQSTAHSSTARQTPTKPVALQSASDNTAHAQGIAAAEPLPQIQCNDALALCMLDSALGG